MKRLCFSLVVGLFLCMCIFNGVTFYTLHGNFNNFSSQENHISNVSVAVFGLGTNASKLEKQGSQLYITGNPDMPLLPQIKNGFFQNEHRPAYYVIIPKEYSLSAEAIQKGGNLLNDYSSFISVIGFSEQQKLRLTTQSNVLWIHNETDIQSSAESRRKKRDGQCVLSDLIDHPFITTRKDLESFLEEAVDEESTTMLEFFYHLLKKGRGVLSCSIRGLIKMEHHSLPQYNSASASFQRKWYLRGVIDERNDAHKRTHDSNDERFYCNTTRAKLFHKMYPRADKQRRGMPNPLATTTSWKAVLDELNLPFILASGTLLGWYRECDFIPYTTDIDTVLPIHHYTPKLEKVAKKHGFQKVHSFGKPMGHGDTDGGFELSFIHQPTKTKVDIFHLYQDVDGMQWTAVWVPQKGKKQRMIERVYFPPESYTDLIPVDFKGLRVLVPRNTEMVLSANYGLDWFHPKEKWSWASSPSNIFLPPFNPWPQSNNVRIEHPNLCVQFANLQLAEDYLFGC
eukprot:gb/GECH01005394.1/.p1 GENE.gb/GECH01005394.1/~~gb/GECH01005394.1/.p1  ORF type:complete len:511 (+),score=32.69 gb/GECH01005394.1/:1-1533(+)